MTVALIDLDVLCYNACENRFRDANGYTIVSIGEPPEDPAADEEYLQKAWLNLQELIQNACEVCFTTEYKAAVAGEGNFRKDIFPLYKANRHADPKKRNPFVPKLRKMAAAAGIATEAHGMEADDLLRIWAEECRNKDEDYIVVSIDKDLLMIPGRHYRIHKQEFVDMSEEAALKFYYEQLLMGDPTDNIGGVPKVGPVKAKKYLEGSADEKSHQEIVQQVYYTAYGTERWKEELILTGHLIYLRKHHEDKFTVEGWPNVEFEEIEEKPKKGKKKMEPWTIGTALAAVDPGNVIGTKAWEAAMLFLAEESGIEIDDDTLGAIEVLSNRNGVPQAELEAYSKLRKAFSGQPIIPLSFNKVVTPTEEDIAKYPFPKEPKVTVVDSRDSSYSKAFGRPPTTILETKEGPVLHTPTMFKLPEAVPVPTFNPDWGKK
jgi:DNA polymerase-1